MGEVHERTQFLELGVCMLQGGMCERHGSRSAHDEVWNATLALQHEATRAVDFVTVAGATTGWRQRWAAMGGDGWQTQGLAVEAWPTNHGAKAAQQARPSKCLTARISQASMVMDRRTD